MIARFALWAVLALTAALVIVVQTDRQAYSDPAAIAMVPPPMRAVAQQRLAELALTAGPLDDGDLAATRHLVRLRPIPAHNLLLYAQTAQLAGHGSAVLAPLEVAAARGWREPVLQLMAGQAALASGDQTGAVARAAALLATGGAPTETTQLLSAIMQSEAGQAELAALLGRPGHYTVRPWRQFAEAGTPDQVLAIATMAAAQSTTFDCDDMRFVAEGWRQGGHQSEADRLLALGCPGTP